MDLKYTQEVTHIDIDVNHNISYNCKKFFNSLNIQL